MYWDQLFYLLIIFCVHNQYLPILYIFSKSFFAADLPVIWIFYNLGTFTVYYSSYSISVTVNRVRQSQCEPPHQSHLTAHVFPLSCLPLTPVTYLEKLSAVWAVTAWGEGCCHESTRGNEWAETKTKQKASGHGVSLYYCTGSPVQLAAASHLLMFKSHLTNFHIEFFFFFF